MGTNYYVKNNYCEHCKRSDDIHIGKSSIGWRFVFNFNFKEYYSDFETLKEYIKDKNIVDEYGEKITSKELLKLIKKKQKYKRGDEYIHIGNYDFLDCEFS